MGDVGGDGFGDRERGERERKGRRRKEAAADCGFFAALARLADGDEPDEAVSVDSTGEGGANSDDESVEERRYGGRSWSSREASGSVVE